MKHSIANSDITVTVTFDSLNPNVAIDASNHDTPVNFLCRQIEKVCRKINQYVIIGCIIATLGLKGLTKDLTD